MIVVMKSHASEDDLQNVIRMVEQLDYSAHVIRGIERTVVACVGEERGEGHSLQHLEARRRLGVERGQLPLDHFDPDFVLPTPGTWSG